MEIFKKITLLIGTLAIALLPFGFSLAFNSQQSWVELFGKGEALLLGVVFAGDALWRCFLQTRDRPSRIIIGMVAAAICLLELPFYGHAASEEIVKDQRTRSIVSDWKNYVQRQEVLRKRPNATDARVVLNWMGSLAEALDANASQMRTTALFSLVCLGASAVLEIAVILEEEL